MTGGRHLNTSSLVTNTCSMKWISACGWIPPWRATRSASRLAHPPSTVPTWPRRAASISADLTRRITTTTTSATKAATRMTRTSFRRLLPLQTLAHRRRRRNWSPYPPLLFRLPHSKCLFWWPKNSRSIYNDTRILRPLFNSFIITFHYDYVSPHFALYPLWQSTNFSVSFLHSPRQANFIIWLGRRRVIIIIIIFHTPVNNWFTTSYIF